MVRLFRRSRTTGLHLQRAPAPAAARLSAFATFCHVTAGGLAGLRRALAQTVKALCKQRWRPLPRDGSPKGLARAANQQTGAQGEEAAYWYLRRHGYTIVARNFRRFGLRGEVDLIGWDGTTLVFIEVKTRAAKGLFPAEQAVNAEKRAQLLRLAQTYMRRRRIRTVPRFDIVTVYSPDAAQPEIALYRDAFRARHAAATGR